MSRVAVDGLAAGERELVLELRAGGSEPFDMLLSHVHVHSVPPLIGNLFLDKTVFVSHDAAHCSRRTLPP